MALDDSPAVIYDKQFILETVKNLQNDLGINEKNHLFFAMKANNNKEILKIFQSLEIGIDVASIQEYELAKEIGFTRISAMNPTFKQSDFLEFDNDVLIDVDSLSQLKKFVSSCKERPFGLRLKSTGEYTAFGVPLDDEIFNYITENSLQKYFRRIHFHNSNRSLAEFRLQLNTAISLIEKYPFIDTINMGGDILGFYRDGRRKFLRELIYIKHNPIFNGINFIYEPGDALIKYGGMLLTKVITIKETIGKTYVFLDSSKWISGPWHTGMPVVLKTRDYNPSHKRGYYLLGNTMFSGDAYFGEPVMLPELREGDGILFPEYGAYTVSNFREFHLFQKPREYLYCDGELIKI
ncbi:hypothetical protein JDW15_06450 [Aerococcaceae bacterium zg-ZJ1578]|uniref:hypothetical protein n=1 Tax=Aerococcaceae bacterium zg-252 TaxID=2796928 RepID=UPI001A28BB10|nr:hypothetical protein [Aerococcaceae bacterium zg-1578]